MEKLIIFLNKIMKQFFVFGVMSFLLIVASTGVASAHGFHAEVLKVAEHMRIHLIENGVSLVISILVIVAGYAMYRKNEKDMRLQDKE